MTDSAVSCAGDKQRQGFPPAVRWATWGPDARIGPVMSPAAAPRWEFSTARCAVI